MCVYRRVIPRVGSLANTLSRARARPLEHARGCRELTNVVDSRTQLVLPKNLYSQMYRNDYTTALKSIRTSARGIAHRYSNDIPRHLAERVFTFSKSKSHVSRVRGAFGIPIWLSAMISSSFQSFPRHLYKRQSIFCFLSHSLSFLSSVRIILKKKRLGKNRHFPNRHEYGKMTVPVDREGMISPNGTWKHGWNYRVLTRKEKSAYKF